MVIGGSVIYPPGSITHDRKIYSAALYEKLYSKVKQCNDKKENKTVNADFYCLKLYIDFYYSRGMSIELKGDCREKNSIICLPDFSVSVFL